MEICFILNYFRKGRISICPNQPVKLSILPTPVVDIDITFASIKSKNNLNTSKKNFTTSILVDQSPEQVFNAINNVRGWWSENIYGNTDKLNAEFLYHYKDVHACKMKITEFVKNKKVVWHVVENEFSFTEDKNEWKGDDIVFEISKKGKQTQLQFTQIGLTPATECYSICNDAWTGYITGSLKNLIVKSKGQPTPKDMDGKFKAALIAKWKLNEKPNRNNFTFSFESSKSEKEVFDILLNVKKWWSGLYGEEIKGSSKKINDEFSFKAGDGVHYSKQRLIELEPNKKIVWLVTESNLSFLKQTNEWTGTKICFEVSKQKNKTKITFTHQGLVPKIECYNACAGAWTQYLENLEESLR